GARSDLRNLDRPADRAARRARGGSRARVFREVPASPGVRVRVSGLLFDREDGAGGRPDASADAPLADRMRPRSLDEVEGPPEVVGANGFLSRAIAEDRVPSLVVWGPPGVGRTTVARLIAAQTSSRFLAYSAIATGVKEMREVLDASRALRAKAGQRTTLFLDEIHRFNRAQQDVFLPYVET